MLLKDILILLSIIIELKLLNTLIVVYSHLIYIEKKDGYSKYHKPVSYSSSRPTEEHLTEHQAKAMVSEMYHVDSNRKYIGEKFDIHKAKEICERYRIMIPKEANYIDVYLVINS